MLFKKLRLCFISLFILISTIYSQQSMIEQSLPYSGLIYYENNSKLYLSYLLTRIEQNSVIVEWRGARLTGLSYQLYRHTEPIIDYEILSKAKLIAIVDANSKTIDYRVKDVLPKNGLYYYAIACVLNNAQLIFTGTPGIDMTARAIELDNNGAIRYSMVTPYEDGEEVSELGYAKQSSGNNVLYWQEAPNYNGNYLIYKSDKVINNIKSLSKAKLIGKTQSSFFVDALTTDGNAYYYVVIDDRKKKDIYSSGNNAQQLSVNYPDAAVTAKRTPVRNLSVVNDTSRVILNWQTPYAVRSMSYFTLVTSSVPFKTGMNVFDNPGIIDIKNIDYNSVSFINDSGKYLFVPRKKEYVNAFIYYALILIENSNASQYTLHEGMFTKYPIKITTLQATDTRREGMPAFIQGERSLDIINMPLTPSEISNLINPPNTSKLPGVVIFDDEYDEYIEEEIITSKTMSSSNNNSASSFVLAPIEIYDDEDVIDTTIFIESSNVSAYNFNNTSNTAYTNYSYSNQGYPPNNNGVNLEPPKVTTRDKITNNIITNTNKIVNTNANISTNTSPPPVNTSLKNEPTIDEKYSNAIRLYNKKDYTAAANLLESISTNSRDVGRYSEINILLGRCYYSLKDKGKSIGAFRRASDAGATEANIWIKKVMNDL